MSSSGSRDRGGPAIQRSWWLREVLAEEEGTDLRTLDGDTDVDVCIIGGGLIGLWTALHVTEVSPGTSVAVVEADLCGSGASGMNGGFAMTWWPKVSTLKKIMGVENALRMVADSQRGVAEMGEFVRRHGIDADFRPAGWLWAATNRSQLDSWRATIDDIAAMGETPFKELTPDQAAQLGGSDRHLGGVYEDGVATIQPAALTRGLRRVAVERGIQVFEHTPMSSYRVRPSGTVAVTTPRGTVRAERLVLATNARLAENRQIRRHLMVLGSDVVVTRPVPELIDESGWQPGLAVSDSRRLVHYYRTTTDGRVVFGKGGGRLGFRGRFSPATWMTSTRADVVTTHMRRIYPLLADVPIADSWAGPVDYSSDSLPFFGTLDGPQVIFAVGFSGNGVGPSFVAGRILASMALETDDEWAHSPMIRTPRNWLPPEPFRYGGGRIVRAAMIRKENSEDNGHRPHRLDSAIAAWDPTTFIG